MHALVLLCINQYTKCLASPILMIWLGQNLKKKWWPWQPAYVRELALATMKRFTEFEVSMFTHYEDMKVDTKCQKWGDLGS